MSLHPTHSAFPRCQFCSSFLCPLPTPRGRERGAGAAGRGDWEETLALEPAVRVQCTQYEGRCLCKVRFSTSRETSVCNSCLRVTPCPAKHQTKSSLRVSGGRHCRAGCLVLRMERLTRAGRLQLLLERLERTGERVMVRTDRRSAVFFLENPGPQGRAPGVTRRNLSRGLSSRSSDGR